MAAVVTHQPLIEPVHRELVPVPFGAAGKLSWGSLFGAAFVVVALFTLLVSIGLAIGLSSVNPDHPDSVKVAAAGFGIWTGIASLISLFIGGFIASRTAGLVDRTVGAIHGAVLWGLKTVFMLFVVFGAARTIGVGAANLMSGQTGQMNNMNNPAMAQERPPQPQPQHDIMVHDYGIGVEDMTSTINDELKNEGKPPMSQAHVQSIMQDAMRTAFSQGHFDRDLFSNQVAAETHLTPSGARDVAGKVDKAYGHRHDLAQMPEGFRTGILRAMDRTGSAMWWVFLGLAVGLISAVFGAILGVTRPQRLAAGGPQYPIPQYPENPPMSPVEPAYPVTR